MQPLDEQALNQLKLLKAPDNSGPLLNLLVDVYNTESPKIMHKLVTAYHAANLEEVAGSAHSLKSSSAQLGAAELAETCRQIEVASRNSAADDALADLVSTAEHQLAEVMQLLLAHKS